MSRAERAANALAGLGFDLSIQLGWFEKVPCYVGDLLPALQEYRVRLPGDGGLPAGRSLATIARVDPLVRNRELPLYTLRHARTLTYVGLDNLEETAALLWRAYAHAHRVGAHPYAGSLIDRFSAWWRTPVMLGPESASVLMVDLAGRRMYSPRWRQNYAGYGGLLGAANKAICRPEACAHARRLARPPVDWLDVTAALEPHPPARARCWPPPGLVRALVARSELQVAFALDRDTVVQC